MSNEPVGTTGCAPLIRLPLGEGAEALATCGACGGGDGRGAAATDACGFCGSVFCGSDFAVSTFRASAAGRNPVAPCGAAGCWAVSLFGLNRRVKKLSWLESAEATWLVL